MLNNSIPSEWPEDYAKGLERTVRFDTIDELVAAAEDGEVPAPTVTITRDMFVDIDGVLDEIAFEIDEYGFISEGLAGQVRSIQADVQIVAVREGL